MGLLGSGTLGALVLGLLLWRESRRLARAESAVVLLLADASNLRSVCVSLRTITKDQGLLIESLEADLATADPTKLFDRAFRVPKKPTNTQKS